MSERKGEKNNNNNKNVRSVFFISQASGKCVRRMVTEKGNVFGLRMRSRQSRGQGPKRFRAPKWSKWYNQHSILASTVKISGLLWDPDLFRCGHKFALKVRGGNFRVLAWAGVEIHSHEVF